MFPLNGVSGRPISMDSPEPEVVSLLRFPPSTVEWIRRAGFAVAVAVVALSWLAHRNGWFDYRPGGVAFTNNVRPIFIGIFLLGAIVALRFELAGGVICGFAAAGLIAFAERQLVTSHAVIVIAALALPALLWIIVDLNSYSAKTASLGLGAAAVAVVVGFGLGQYVYEYFWGPTHPESVVDDLAPSDVEWAWSGAVTDTSARVTVKTAVDGDVRLLVTDQPDADTGRFVSVENEDGRIRSFAINGLSPDTNYHYAVEVNGELDQGRRGRFSTFPVGPASFRLAVGACARVGSNGAVFDAVMATDPRAYLIIGDMHYGDVPEDDRARYEEVLDLTLTRPAQSELYRSTPVAYVWDDHDYGPNDSDSLSLSRAAAMDAYRTYVPSYPLDGPLSSVHQSFTIGRVRVVMTDARSNRVPGETMLGPKQKAWLLDELATASKDHAAVLWINPVPWVTESGADSWAGYREERAEIAEFIAGNEIENLVMISGDAHMVAIDDGTNTNFSSVPGPSFPLLHTAALDRPGSTKGGPYSHGKQGGGGQFGVVDISDDGETVTVTLEARNWRNESILSYTFTPRLPASMSG